MVFDCGTGRWAGEEAAVFEAQRQARLRQQHVGGWVSGFWGWHAYTNEPFRKTNLCSSSWQAPCLEVIVHVVLPRRRPRRRRGGRPRPRRSGGGRRRLRLRTRRGELRQRRSSSAGGQGRGRGQFCIVCICTYIALVIAARRAQAEAEQQRRWAGRREHQLFKCLS